MKAMIAAITMNGSQIQIGIPGILHWGFLLKIVMKIIRTNAQARTESLLGFFVKNPMMINNTNTLVIEMMDEITKIDRQLL